MPYDINETHDPNLRSWVESANDSGTDFPIQNLPFVYIADPNDMGMPEHLGVRIGDKVLNLFELSHVVAFLGDTPVGEELFHIESCEGMYESAATPLARRIRRRLQEMLDANAPSGLQEQVSEHLFDADGCYLENPPARDYTDFYASLHHATNVGSMFRPDNPLLPNYKHIPIGYHGRASSIVPSGTPIRRPVGQLPPAEEGGAPGFGACRMLDYEMELGVVIGRGNELGEAIPVGRAAEHVFGMCIVNDWSARDVQRWEYQPLGPFLSKSFATTVSPYIVTMEALAPFRVPAFERPPGDPRPLPYLDDEADRARGGIDITCEVFLASADMRKRGLSPVRLSRGSFRQMYWTIAQMVAHHTVNGCNLQPGDLLASGTVSGPARENRGCLLELTWDGDPWANPPRVVPGSQRTPIELPTGEKRTFLQDGDEVVMRAFCEREGFRRIGFGECRGIVEPARG
ncbi:MAG TPA: fumarylacetoacetase [Phycisphaerales bacterium]|nr:fumarylacetoacetase [Phycisphaerales bacterium]